MSRLADAWLSPLFLAAISFGMTAHAFADPPTVDPLPSADPPPVAISAPREPLLKKPEIRGESAADKAALVLETDKGTIRIRLDADTAPRLRNALQRIVAKGQLDGLTLQQAANGFLIRANFPIDGLPLWPGEGLGGVAGSLVACQTLRGSGGVPAEPSLLIQTRDMLPDPKTACVRLGQIESGQEVIDALQSGGRITHAAYLESRPARPVRTLYPVIPEDLRSQPYEGGIGLKVTVHPDGSADYAIVKSSGNSHVDDCVMSALQHWKWQPALKDGKPVISALDWQFNFSVR